MKIGTLTFHTAANYGAVLQTYALVAYLRNLGADAEVIDYRAPFNTRRFSKQPLRNFFKPRELYSVLFRNSYQLYNTTVFSDFLHKYVPLSKTVYTSQAELSGIENRYDKVISGSDQVWNLACTEGDDSYFLPFVSDNEKKCTYAASLGFKATPPTKQSTYRQLIEGFNHISVREQEGAEIIKDLCQRNVTVVVDPTLLLTPKQWAEIADFTLCPKDRKYLLLYLMSEDHAILRFARHYAKEHGLEILYITQRLFKRINATFLRNVTPCQWVGLFLNADTIVTNSFHGSAFGVNFNKNLFVKYIPRSIANSRLENIINDYSLHHHLIGGKCFDDSFLINQDTMKSVLEEKRQLSINFIEQEILDK